MFINYPSQQPADQSQQQHIIRTKMRKNINMANKKYTHKKRQKT